MPLYEYKCHDCSEQFEVMHSMSTNLRKCNSCESENIERVIGTPSITFNCSGFYHTDYKNKSSNTKTEKKDES